MSDDKRDRTATETEAAEAEEAQPENGAAEDTSESAEPAEEKAAEPTPEEQLADMKDKLLRAMAEVENVRRRSEREKADAQKFGISRFARDLLSVADNLRRAIDAVPGDKREELDEVTRNLITGVEMVERELLGVFEGHGIKPLVPEKGAKFDPNLHQAMAEVPDPEAPPGSVSDVFQTGYVIGDRLLRPAMVTVARAPANEDGAEKKKDRADTGAEAETKG